jgi:hypothetical protein
MPHCHVEYESKRERSVRTTRWLYKKRCREGGWDSRRQKEWEREKGSGWGTIGGREGERERGESVRGAWERDRGDRGGREGGREGETERKGVNEHKQFTHQTQTCMLNWEKRLATAQRAYPGPAADSSTSQHKSL